MAAALNRLTASVGDLEASVSDAITALGAAAAGTDETALNELADRVDAATKSLNTALVPPQAAA